jgi:hypothetical protein
MIQNASVGPNGEDGLGARALAAIRNLVLYLIRSRGMSVPEARENFREDRAEAIAAVRGRIL